MSCRGRLCLELGPRTTGVNPLPMQQSVHFNLDIIAMLAVPLLEVLMHAPRQYIAWFTPEAQSHDFNEHVGDGVDGKPTIERVACRSRLQFRQATDKPLSTNDTTYDSCTLIVARHKAQ